MRREMEVQAHDGGDHVNVQVVSLCQGPMSVGRSTMRLLMLMKLWIPRET
jgi:hypothetical protein